MWIQHPIGKGHVQCLVSIYLCALTNQGALNRQKISMFEILIWISIASYILRDPECLYARWIYVFCV
jgi:hypothetical protein